MENKDFSFSKKHQEALKIVREEIVAQSYKETNSIINGLSDYFVDFRNGSPYQGSKLFLCTPTLRQAILAFWQDVIRLQSYHPINVINRFKRAAFIFKWICKCRPIKIVSTYPPECAEDYTRVNAIFAMHCAMAFLKCPPPNGEELKEIIYTGTFRCIQPEQMA